MNDCLFCKIVRGEIPCTKVFENEYVLAFRDINPQAPVHIIVIPKEHIMSSMDDYDKASCGTVLAEVFDAIRKIAAQEGLSTGYRIINNCGHDAGQTVRHIHFHLLAGADMGEKLV